MLKRRIKIMGKGKSQGLGHAGHARMCTHTYNRKPLALPRAAARRGRKARGSLVAMKGSIFLPFTGLPASFGWYRHSWFPQLFPLLSRLCPHRPPCHLRLV